MCVFFSPTCSNFPLVLVAELYNIICWRRLYSYIPPQTREKIRSRPLTIHQPRDRPISTGVGDDLGILGVECGYPHYFFFGFYLKSENAYLAGCVGIYFIFFKSKNIRIWCACRYIIHCRLFFFRFK